MGTGDLRLLCTAATGSEDVVLAESERAALACMLSTGFEDEAVTSSLPSGADR
ncbi:hypothetical protein [Streptomyces sp. NPDC101237]|uniref:hypothetical protein n=1 Tax=Streptomyces sp. NPDC101237 TaxID=3366139 RepID=UPI0037FB1431